MNEIAHVRRGRSVIDMKENAWEIRNDEVARRLLGDNVATGTVRFLLLTFVYIVASVLITSWLLR